MTSWYEVTQEKELQQGDILLSCPVPVLPAQYPPDTTGTGADAPLVFEGKLEVRNVVILSQSCDLINRKLASVIVGPIWPIERLPELANDDKLRTESKRLASLQNFIRNGYSPRFHMLEASSIESHPQNISIVDFWAVYTVPLGFLEMFAAYSGARLRLVSPYTEHLSQAFARFVMRVGLPSPIQEF